MRKQKGGKEVQGKLISLSSGYDEYEEILFAALLSKSEG